MHRADCVHCPLRVCQEHRPYYPRAKLPYLHFSKHIDVVSDEPFFVIGGRWVAQVRYVDLGFICAPYFLDAFNYLDLVRGVAVSCPCCADGSRVVVLVQALFCNMLAIIIVHIVHVTMSDKVVWSQRDNELLFVDVYTLADVSAWKVYLLATMWGLSCLKTLEFLRINRDLSTFILVIQVGRGSGILLHHVPYPGSMLQGMLRKLGSFFVVMFVVLAAFAGWQYISFGTSEVNMPRHTVASGSHCCVHVPRFRPPPRPISDRLAAIPARVWRHAERRRHVRQHGASAVLDRAVDLRAGGRVLDHRPA